MPYTGYFILELISSHFLRMITDMSKQPPSGSEKKSWDPLDDGLPEYLTQQQAAQHYGVSYYTIRTAVMGNQIPTVNFGGRAFIPREFILAHVVEAGVRFTKRIVRPREPTDPVPQVKQEQEHEQGT